MRPYRARFREQGVFFAFQSWAACIINIFGFDLRQAQTDSRALGPALVELRRTALLIAIPPIRGVQAMPPGRTETAQPPEATWRQKTEGPRHRHVSGQKTGSR